MAVLRNKDVKKLGERDLNKKLNELRLELTKERANIAIGASATSPGRIREIRRAIARILTEKSSKQKLAAGKAVKEPAKEKVNKETPPKQNEEPKKLAKGVEGK